MEKVKWIHPTLPQLQILQTFLRPTPSFFSDGTSVAVLRSIQIAGCEMTNPMMCFVQQKKCFEFLTESSEICSFVKKKKGEKKA